MNIIKICNIKI